MSRYRDIEFWKCRVDVEMSRCRDVEREKSRILAQNATDLLQARENNGIAKSQNGDKGLYSISSLKLPFLQGTSGS